MKIEELSISELLEDHENRYIGSGDAAATGKEILRRFSALEAEVKRLKGERDNLKCCGNCIKRYRYDCILPSDEESEGCSNYKYNNRPQHICSQWQSDAMTKEERGK